MVWGKQLSRLSLHVANAHSPHNGFHDATCDPFQIEIWWRQWPDANIGTPMGHGRFALDIDPRAGGDDTLFALERQHGPLPHTLLSHTGGGGSHYLFLEPPGGILNKADIGQGIDVQGLGSYIILPPSIHPDTGKPYLWDVVDGPDDIDPQPAPDWLLALLTAPAPRQTAPQRARAADHPRRHTRQHADAVCRKPAPGWRQCRGDTGRARRAQSVVRGAAGRCRSGPDSALYRAL